eukprot:TRINITY_DN12477_c0_g1_i1.p3 TRINITY_DN12477_c0_g1~~TRINITY_DN12477_c0_g1_i1.p3  ORF type:complete len:118 (+),score=42.92 TRINITY_DN12477_c0_g1_i1:32-355(+)
MAALFVIFRKLPDEWRTFVEPAHAIDTMHAMGVRIMKRHPDKALAQRLRRHGVMLYFRNHKEELNELMDRLNALPPVAAQSAAAVAHAAEQPTPPTTNGARHCAPPA